MKKHYLSVLVLAMTLIFASALALRAQHTVSVSNAPLSDYSNKGESFSALEIAEELGIDTASLHKLITAEGSKAVYLTLAEGETNEYTGNQNEFWLTAQASPVAHAAEGCCWYVGITYNDEYVDEETQEKVDGTVYVYTGQYPNFFKQVYESTMLKCQLSIVNGEKKASFDITQNVEAAIKPNLAPADTLLHGINIVADYEVELPFITGKSYEGKSVSIDMGDIYEKLGIGVDDMATFKTSLDTYITDHLFTEDVYSKTVDGNTTYYLSDTLRLPDVAAGGSWFGRYINYEEATGNEVPMEINCPKVWATGCTFYTQEITLVEGTFTVGKYGQYPGTFKAGDTDYTYLYIVVGSNAARIKVQAKVEDPAAIDPSQMVKVGEETIQISADVDNNYQTKSFSVDIAAIAEKLECAVADITEFYAYDQSDNISANHTEGTSGYYYNDEGKIEAWGDKAACFISPVAIAEGSFKIGQMINHFKDITEPTSVKPQFIFKNENNFYLVTVEYTVKPIDPDAEPKQYTCVASEGINFEMIPSESEYQYATTTTIDLDYIESKIATRDFVLYTDKVTTEGEETKFDMNKTYTCSPAPGFWYGDKTYTNAEGQVVVDNAGWGSNSFGITYATGVITWWQYPGQRKVGDTYTANLYLVNEETGNYIRYVLNVAYVEKESEKATLTGIFDKNIIVSPENTGDGYLKFNLESQQIADSLLLNVNDLADNVTVYAFKTPNTRTSYGFDEEIYLDAEGYVNENSVITVAPTIVEGLLAVGVDLNEYTFDKGSDEKAVIRLSFEANSRRIDYVYTLYSEDSPILTGIVDAPSMSDTPAVIYNVTGTKVPTLVKGINIIKHADGTSTKVLVK